MATACAQVHLSLVARRPEPALSSCEGMAALRRNSWAFLGFTSTGNLSCGEVWLLSLAANQGSGS